MEKICFSWFLYEIDFWEIPLTNENTLAQARSLSKNSWEFITWIFIYSLKAFYIFWKFLKEQGKLCSVEQREKWFFLADLDSLVKKKTNLSKLIGKRYSYFVCLNVVDKKST